MAVREVGKVVVARNGDGKRRLETLFDRGMSNGVKLEIFDVESSTNMNHLPLLIRDFFGPQKPQFLI